MPLLSLLDEERLTHPGASDADCVRAIARRVVDELGVAAPPVNVGMLASYLDVAEVIVDRDLDVAGCLICTGGTIEIRVRAHDSAPRRRFTRAPGRPLAREPSVHAPLSAEGECSASEGDVSAETPPAIRGASPSMAGCVVRCEVHPPTRAVFSGRPVSKRDRRIAAAIANHFPVSHCSSEIGLPVRSSDCGNPAI